MEKKLENMTIFQGKDNQNMLTSNDPDIELIKELENTEYNYAPEGKGKHTRN